MALQVWLSLTGNLENKGLNGATVKNTNATVNASGKLGQCYAFTNSHLYLPTSIVTSTKTWSYCCWAKISSFPAADSATLYTQRSAINSTARSIFVRNSTTMYVDNGVRVTISKRLPTLSNWNHFAFVCSSTQIIVYINGELFETKTISDTAYSGISNDATIGASKQGAGDTVAGSNRLNGYLNDVRIYDHCLSQQEVREISKGLILHYPLDNVKVSQNIMTKMSTIGTSTTSGWHIYMGNKWTIENGIGHCTQTGVTSDVWQMLMPARTIINASELTSEYFVFSFDLMTTNTTSLVADGNTLAYLNTWSTTSHRCGWCGRVYNSSVDNFKWILAPTLENNKWARVAVRIKSSYAKTLNSESTSDVPAYIQIGFGSNRNFDYYVKNPKLEYGDTYTEWCPNSSDPEYNQLGYNDATIYDCSGFGNNGEIRGSGTTSVDTSSPRYSADTLVNGSAITLGTYDSTIGKLVSQPFTVSFWVYPVSNTSVGVNALLDIGRDGLVVETTRWFIYNSSHTATVKDGSTVTLNTWNHIAVSFDGTTVKMYKNGASTTSITGVPAMAGSGVSGLNARFANTYCNFNNRYSDVRFYATALSADDVKLLYNRGASIDNAGNLHCGELVEDNTATKQQVKKNTQVKSRYFSELPLKYDDTIYVEPDGSMWVRIVRQNNPTSNKFASTDSFTTSVYKSVNTWFYASFCNYVDKWELMVKQFIRNATSETKYRWVQQYNPMTATYANVARANITYNTSSGYATPASTYGGLYNINTNTKLCANNNTSGNWFGAIGSWSAHDGGIPGWNNTVVTTGYEDLYLRIDNVTFVNLPANTKTQFLKSGDINSTEIYEQ